MLGYKLDQAGFLAAFPYLLMAGIVQSAGVLADFARTKGRLNTTQVRKLFTCGSYACQFFFMSLTALFMTSGGAVTCISLSLGCGGKQSNEYYTLEIPASRVFLGADTQLLWTSLAGARMPLSIFIKSRLKLNIHSSALPRSTPC